jgi:hypothetical protein
MAALALPGLGHADTAIFSLQSRTLPPVKANGTRYTYSLATVTNPTAYYGNCSNYNALPYVLVTPGAFGNFLTDPTGQTNFYLKLTKMVYALAPKCIRVIGIEAPDYSVFDYPGSIVLPADIVGADYWVNLPMRRASTYLRDVIRDVQGQGAFAYAPRWFLQGGSGSSMYSAKLLDSYRNSTDANASGFVFPIATILESLPSSGNLYKACRYSNDVAVVKQVANTIYRPIFGYQANPTTFVEACTNIVANPNSHNWNFLAGDGLAYYTAQGKRIYVMNGANDDLYKNGTSYLADSWTMDQLLIDFSSVTRKCAGQPFYNSSVIYDRNAFFNCDIGTYAGLYQGGGHGPVASSNPYAIDDLANTAIGPGVVRGTIDGVAGNAVSGWACAYASRTPISVHLYVGGSAGIGTLIGSYPANNASEPAVASVCSGRGTAYRFSIPLPLAVRQAHAGKRIYIHGIHPTGAYNNDLLANSGVFSVPAP